MKRFLVILLSVFLFLPFFLKPPVAKADTGPSDPESLPVRVYLIIYDPILEGYGPGGTNVRLHTFFENQYQLPAQSLDPVGFSVQIKDTFDSKSHGKAKFQLVGQEIRDEWPLHMDGTRYTDSQYASEVIANNFTKDFGDYGAIINDNQTVQKINNGEIDEVWLWGGPGFGWAESKMAGPGAYFLNADPLLNVATNRAFVLMGLSYAETLVNGIESFGHRIEDTMTHVYGGTWAFPYYDTPATAPAVLTPWDEFSIKEYDPMPYAGCGFAHGSLNAPTYDAVNNPHSYDYSNLYNAYSSCNDWYNFPFMTGAKTYINCTAWDGPDPENDGCNNNPDFNFLVWWYDHMPYKAGSYDGYATNWWRYITDVDQYKVSGRVDGTLTDDLSEDIDESHWYVGHASSGQGIVGTYSNDGTGHQFPKEGGYTRWFQSTYTNPGESWLGYAPPTAPHIDATNKTFVFWAFGNAGTHYVTGNPKVLLKTSDSSYYQYTASTALFNLSIQKWQKYEIPVNGGGVWTRTSVGSPNLTDINKIEFRAEATPYGGFYSLFDGIRFSTNDITLPTISITSPTSGQNVSGTVTITTAVSDNSAIKRVDLFVDGQYVLTDATKPYVFFWDSSSVSNGSHTLTAKVYDMHENSATSVGVSVNTGAGSDHIFSDAFESGNTSAWSSETDTESDLNVTTGAALHDTKGLAALVDNTTEMYVTDTAPANETRYRARFYLDPNSISMASADTFSVFAGRNSGGSAFHVQLNYSTTSGYRIKTIAYDDAAAYTSGAYAPISDGPHSIEVDWKAATSVGANNGYITLWIDGVQESNQTGLDNDTKRIEEVRLGAVANIDTGTNGTVYLDDFVSGRLNYIGPIAGGGSDVIFTNGFESGNTSGWSSETDTENDLNVNGSAAMEGSWGLAALIDNVTNMYVSDLNPSSESRYRARFYFDPNSISMASADTLVIFNGRNSAGSAFYVHLNYSSVSGYRVRTVIYDDSATGINGAWVPITDAAHSIEIDWQAATSPGANNGYISLWVDGTVQGSQGSIDNDTKRVDEARLGAVTSIDVGTLGTLYFDKFDSRKTGYIGP